MPIPRTLNHDFFKTWSPEMAYILGLFAADGAMIRNNRDAHFIEFTLTDRVLLELMQGIVNSNHKIATRVRKIEKGSWKPQYRIQFGSKAWHADLTTLGFMQNKSNILAFPEVPTKYLSDFVRGYFDGDGCVHFSTYHPKDRPAGKKVFMTSFTSGSQKFLQKLKVLLGAHGLQGGSLYKKERGGALSYSSRDSVALYRFMYHTRPVLTYLPRKRKVFETAMRDLGYKVRP